MKVKRVTDNTIIVTDGSGRSSYFGNGDLAELIEGLQAVEAEVVAEAPASARQYADERGLGHALQYADPEEIEVEVEIDEARSFVALEAAAEVEHQIVMRCSECGIEVLLGAHCPSCGKVVQI